VIEETMLDNVLVGQEDRILSECNKGNYSVACTMLTVVAELWVQTGHSYKGREVANRIIVDIDKEIETMSMDDRFYYPDMLSERRNNLLRNIKSDVRGIAVGFCERGGIFRVSP
jgi:hypothetical protein